MIFRLAIVSLPSLKMSDSKYITEVLFVYGGHMFFSMDVGWGVCKKINDHKHYFGQYKVSKKKVERNGFGEGSYEGSMVRIIDDSLILDGVGCLVTHDCCPRWNRLNLYCVN